MLYNIVYIHFFGLEVATIVCPHVRRGVRNLFYITQIGVMNANSPDTVRFYLFAHAHSQLIRHIYKEGSI